MSRMDESKVLEKALKNCQTLQQHIYDSIKQVRRLNIRYNSEWLLKNYQNYLNTIWSQYGCRSPETRLPRPSKHYPNGVTASNGVVQTVRGARSSIELFGANRKINYKFIKIKRSMEVLMIHIQRAIEIGNRQRNYMHVSVTGRGTKVLLCCH